ncbi:MAG: hypothetical protein QF926_06375 [Alphaproteobacteria bacterium]|jgi:hypothetical protein|nr:hypothetical protein [Alphaproteobacteria bacterium]MDP6516228.1 hypothetical protein [Alphaproteobacteria bacterium]
MSQATKTICVLDKPRSNQERSPDEFRELKFAERRWADGEYASRYHIFRSRNPNDRVTVVADSAAQAMRECGVKRPYLIQRGANMSEQKAGIIGKGRLVKV